MASARLLLVPNEVTEEPLEVQLFEGVNDVLTVAQVAELLQVSRKTVYEECKRSRLEGVHIGSSLRILKTELIRYLTEGNDNE